MIFDLRLILLAGFRSSAASTANRHFKQINDLEVEVMKLFRFSFKYEPLWTLLLSLVPAVAGLLILLLAFLLGRLG